jgi:nitrogen regulatory protein PII
VKQVIAILKPHAAEKTLDELVRYGVVLCIVREVKGFGRQKNYLDQYQDSEYSMAFLPKVFIAFWVETDRLEGAIERIVGSARSGRMGDGKIFVLGGEGIDGESS